MAGKVKSFSNLIENQLPEFITSEYPKFVNFVQKYYEQLEGSGQPLDIINNLSKYQDLDTYEKKILNEYDSLVSIVETKDSNNIITEIIINLTDSSSFPKKNGYVMIDEEIIFYSYKQGNSLRDCYRNVSGTTRLGDLYNSPDYKSVPFSEVGKGSSGQTVSGPSYSAGTLVYNISNLFLYALVKNFEKQYLSSFPEENLKQTVDKKTLIKNIKYFYQAKGTEQSIKFIFNSIVSQQPEDVPTVYYPKDYTFKASNGEWINKYALKCKLLSGDPSKIIGQRITQSYDSLDASISFATVDNVIDMGNGFYEIILAPETIVGEFKIAAETQLTKLLSSSKGLDDIIDVFSTAGWESTSGKLLIGNEEITYKSKNINQFVIESRGSSPQSYPELTKIYNYVPIDASYQDIIGNNFQVKLIVLGVLYNLVPTSLLPYCFEGDILQESKTGFDTRDTIVYDNTTGNIRWKLNLSLSNPSSVNILPIYKTKIQNLNSDVSTIFEDNQYYYIASSSYPSHDFGKSSWNNILEDQKHLKLIKKSTSLSTEIFKTSTYDVGVALNGVPFYGYKDYTTIDGSNNDVIFGGIIDIVITNKGKNYQNAPYVLIEEKIGVEAAKARSILAGEVVDSIVVDYAGTGYFPPEPTVTITSGRNGIAEAVVTLGKVTSLKLKNSGEYYSTAPEVRIIDKLGKGRFARYKTTISNDGKITGFIKEDEGKFYTQENIEVKIIPVGEGASAYASVRRWKKNRFYNLKSSLDTNNGYFFKNINPALGFGYGYLANPVGLRIQLGDNLNPNGSTFSNLIHSKILGYAYDGNPIYGPYGYSDPLSASSNIVKMTSSYELKNSRISGPPVATYPLGYFIEDYRYNHRLGSLDENNGRFCVTPEYPNGIYAYFITCNENDVPVFPYVLGDNFYSVPSDTNYTKQISQNDLPKLVSRIRTSNITNNGSDTFSYIDEINSGSVSNLNVFSSHNNFSVGSLVEVDNSNTSGSGIVAKVSSIKGKSVSSIENRQIKAVQIKSENTAYLFKDDILYQENTNASGQIIGDVFDGKNIVLRNVTGSFNLTDKLFSNIKVINLIIDKSSNFTANSTLILTNGKQTVISNVTSNTINVSSNPFVNGEAISFSNTFSSIISNTIYYVKNRTINSFQISATPSGNVLSLSDNNTPTSIAVSEKGRALILETTEDKNNIKCKVLQGEFIVDGTYFLTSSTRTDTVGTRISQVNKLSEDIKIFKLNDNIAIVSTVSDHDLAEGDIVNIDINPDEVSTLTTYYVRRRVYQKIKLKEPKFETILSDTGIGRLRVLNSGADYSNNGSQTYTNIELIFSDQTKCRDIDGRIVGSSNPDAVLGNVGGSNNAKATVTVTNGKISNVSITSKGSGYKKGDSVTFSNSSLFRVNNSLSTQFFVADVDHVGFSFNETILKLNTVEGLSQNDLIKIGKEILKVNNINFNQKTVSVVRSQENTTAVDHFNNQSVVLYKSKYNLSKNYVIGPTVESGIIDNYDTTSQILTIVFDLSIPIENINRVDLNYAFFDESSPKKLVSIEKVIDDASYKFEFSKINSSLVTWEKNPIFKFQKFYRYRFDTSNPTLLGSFLEFSPSGNKNILTLESFRSSAKPGSSNSYIDVKFGYGPFYNYSTSPKESINYTNYYYFDKNKIINSDNSYIKLIDDPLQGQKNITYVTPNKFVYELSSLSAYDGTGTITYTTSSSSAIGQINTVLISNPGKEYKSIPTVIGIRPSPYNEATVKANWASVTKTIESVNVVLPGKNYSKPKAVVVSGDGSFADFTVVTNSEGSVTAVLVNNKGKNYSYLPEIKIIETDLKAYFDSNTIGTPKSIKVVNNGYNFNRDQSISKKYSSYTILVLKDFIKDAFLNGEEIVQYNGNILIAKGIVSTDGWKNGSNILRLKSVEGIFRYDLPILGRTKNNSANIIKSFANDFSPQIKSYYDNLGYYISDRSNIGSESQRLADSYFYQDYSYTIKSKTPIDVWRNLIKNTTHPAGFKVFAEVELNTSGDVRITSNPKVNTVSFIQLWDPQKNRVSIESTRRTVTSTIVKVKDVNEVRGKGQAFVAPFDTTETISYEFYLDPPFNGYINGKGDREGTKSFTMKIKGSNSPLNVSNFNNLIISLDGIIQEPNKAYTINGSTITFTEAPLGRRFSEGSFGNDSLTAINTVSSYDIKFQTTISQLDLSYFVVGQEFTTSSASRQIILYKSPGVIATEMDGLYKVVDKGVDGNFYNVVSFTNNIGNTTATLILSSVSGLDANSAGLGISGNGIIEGSGLQGIDIANKTITISGLVSSNTIGSVRIGPRYVTLRPSGKLLKTLENTFATNVLNGTNTFSSKIKVDGYDVNTKSYFVNYQTRSYVTGVDTPSQDFIGRLIKFKDVTLNASNFKKIKNISSEFDNTKTSFKLYYEDNTPVELPSSDNLLVSIDGVIQKSGVSPLLPADRAYYIKRTVIPNEIVFQEPPRKFEEISDNQLFNKTKQSFFASNIAAYERLKIDEQYIDDTFAGPFILRSATTGKTIAVDDDRNVLVFIEEVLQKRLKNYQIRGSNITFAEPLRIGQKINIMYLYGRNTVKYLTIFDHDHNDYLNRIELQINYNPGFKQFTNIFCYQGNSLSLSTATGTIKKFDVVETNLSISSITANGTTVTVNTNSPHGLRAGQEIRVYNASDSEYNIKKTNILPFDLNTNSFKYQVPFAPTNPTATANIVFITTTFVLETQNKKFVKTKDVYCFKADAAFESDQVIPFSSINAVGQALSSTGGSVYFEETEETLDILRKTTTGWLIGSSREPNYWDALKANDFIKIDGENDFRTVLSVPSEVVKTEYREEADVTTGYLGKITTTNYNGIQQGEGLDVLANIDTDSSSPTFGQVISLTWNKKDYESFVTKGIRPRPAGYSYEDGPRLQFVPQAKKDEGGSIISPAAGGGARGYVVYHNGEPIDVVLTDGGNGYETPPKVYITRGYTVKKSKTNSHHRIITNFFTPLVESNRLIVTSGADLSARPEKPEFKLELFQLVGMANRDIVITNTIKITAAVKMPFNQPITPYFRNVFSFGYVDSPVSAEVFVTSVYGGVVASLSNSTVSVQNIKKEILLDLRSFLKVIYSPVYPTLYDTGAYLQSPLSKTDSIIYIADTSKFSPNGRLMINGEIIRYNNKFSDRFTNIVRGVDGTSARIHDAGDFVRQYRENVTLVSAGVAGGSGTSEIISIGSISSGFASVNQIVTTNQIQTLSELVEISPVVTSIIQDKIFTNSISKISEYNTISYFTQSIPKLVTISSGGPTIITGFAQIITQFPTIVSFEDELVTFIEDTVITDSVVNIGATVTTSSSTQSIPEIVTVISGGPTIIETTVQSIANTSVSEISFDLHGYSQIKVFANSIQQISAKVTAESQFTSQAQPFIMRGSYNSVTFIVQSTAPKLSSINPSIEKYYETGFVDYYVESILLTEDIQTRTGVVTLDPVIRDITLRDGSILRVSNSSTTFDTNLDSYLRSSVGNHISTLESWKFMDTGTISNSGVSIEEYEYNYKALTLEDLENYNYSSWLKSKIYWNAGYPGIYESGATLNNDMTNTSTVITVQQPTTGSNPLSKFPTSGKIVIGKEIITYTGKTSTTLTGITRSTNSVIESHITGDYIRTLN